MMGFIKLRLFLLLIVLIGIVNHSTAQNPTYKMYVTNMAQLDSNIIEFDVYLLRTGSVQLELAYVQIGLKMDSAITRMNTSTAPYHSYVAASYISGSSQLNSAQTPTSCLMPSVKVNGWAQNDHSFRIPAQIVFTSGGGSIISNVNSGCTSPGTRIGRFRMTNQFSSSNSTPVAFATNTTTSAIFNQVAAGLYATSIAAFVSGNPSAVDITDPSQHYSYNTSGTCFNNITINPTPSINANGIVPTTINSGINSILTINGSGFGATRGKGFVLMTNADSAGTVFHRIMDTIDYKSWTDTKIEIYLPSRTTDSIAGFDFTPGSGVVYVQNTYGYKSIASTQSVNINYAIHTNFSGSFTSKRRQCLARYKCKNGFIFYLANNITVGSAMQQTIDSALAAWSNYLDIDIKLARNSGGSIIQVNPTYTDNDTSVILIDNSLAAPALMETARRLYPLSPCLGSVYYKEGDIRIRNTSANWDYSINATLPQGMNDFYGALLHEIGHVLGLDHAIDLGANGNLELMYRGQSPGAVGGTPASGRKTLTSAGANSAAGVNIDIVSYSRTLTPNCTDLNPLTTRSVSSPTISPTAPIVICTGGNTNLTSSAANSSASGNVIANLWSNSATTQTINVSGSTATYTVTVTQNSGCSATASKLVTVAGTSTISSHPSNASTCSGGTASFTCTSSGATYQWQRSIAGGAWTDIVNGALYSGATLSTLNILSANYYSGSSQLYRCVATQTGFCPTPSNSASLAVTPVSLSPSILPSVYTGSPGFTLSGGAPSGGSYSGTGVSGTTFTPPGSAGTYTITYTKSGCSPASASQSIEVVSCGGTYPSCVKTITTNNAPSLICMDGSNDLSFNLNFTALGCPYTLGNIFTAQLSSASGSFTSPTNIGSISNTGGGFPNCTGTINATILGSTTTGTGYRIRVVSNNPVVTGPANSYDIIIDHSPCDLGFRKSDTKNIITENDIKLYPNPAKEEVTIELPTNGLYFQLSIFDMSGKLMLNDEIENLTKVIDTQNYPQGIYVVKLSNSSNVINKKLLIIK